MALGVPILKHFRVISRLINIIPIFHWPCMGGSDIASFPRVTVLPLGTSETSNQLEPGIMLDKRYNIKIRMEIKTTDLL